MYYANDKKFGFWIKRDTWENTIAKVTFTAIRQVLFFTKLAYRWC
jgi:hypothetical protein